MCYYFSKCNTMMPSIAQRMISKNLSKVKFEFGEINWDTLRTDEFGVYLHVPFCTRLCAFCPFYKVLYDEDLKDSYLDALKKEIESRPLDGKMRWLYMGGGTPNLLSVDEISSILSVISDRVELQDIGMEGNPNRFTGDYIRKLSKLGFGKISTGVESLSAEALKRVNREKTSPSLVRRIVETANEEEIKTNVDLMTGLPGQSVESFLGDVDILGRIGPSQITIYPFLAIPGVRIEPSLSSERMFAVIEESGQILEEYGYKRDSIWIFAQTSEIYDSSGDELVNDYLGFGPAAFNTIGQTQAVNPPLELYLDMIKEDSHLALTKQVDKASENWRKLAHELYGLSVDEKVVTELPFGARFMYRILNLTGNVHNGKVTKKGLRFVHGVTKSVVESLPFPIGNRDAIENVSEFMTALENSGKTTQ